MTTRNLVPRGDSEGKLGISNKRWEEVNSATLKVTNLQNASGSLLLKKGPGIGDIALDSSDQLKIALDSTFLTSLGFNADGTQPDFAENGTVLAGDSFLAAINKLDQAVDNFVNPTTLTVGSFSPTSVLVAGEPFVDDDTQFMTSAAIDDRIESKTSGAGLSVSGSYTAPSASNYLSGASTLKAADSLLDTQIKINETAIATKASSSSVSANTSSIATNTSNISAIDTRVTTNESDISALESTSTAQQTEVDASQASIGLSAAGAHVARSGTNYLDTATTIVGEIGLLDAQVRTNEQDITSIETQITTIVSEGDTSEAAIVALQSELDTTQAGAGLSGAGNYTAPGTSNYLSGGTTLKAADSLLDTQIKANETAIGLRATEADLTLAEADIVTNTGNISTNTSNISTNTSDITALETEMTATQSGVGLNANGTYTALTGNYNTGSTLKGAVSSLDTQVKSNFDSLATKATAVQLSALDLRVTNAEDDIDDLETLQTAQEAAIGLSTAGAHVARSGTNYLNSASSIAGEITALDTQLGTTQGDLDTAEASIVTNASNISTNTSNISSNDTDITTLDALADTHESSIGLNANGSYTTVASSNYLESATTIKGSLEDLDTQLKSTQDDLDTAESTIVSHTSSLSTNASAISSNTSNISSNDTEIQALEDLADTHETSIGLNNDGGYTAISGANYATSSVSIKAAVTQLDTQLAATQAEVDAEETARASGDNTNAAAINTVEASVGLAGDGSLTISGTNFIDGQSSVVAAVTVLDTNIASLDSIQDNIRDAAGTNLTGSLTNYANTNFISNNTSLKAAIEALDTQVNTNATNITGISGTSITELQDEVDAIETAAGLAAGGAYVAHSGTNYMDSASTMLAARELLDAELASITVDNFNSSAIDTDLTTASSNDNTIASAKATKAYVDGKLGRFGGIFKTKTITAAVIHADGETVISAGAYDVEFDSSPIIRSHFGPFAFDLGQLITDPWPGGSDIIFYGATASGASDRHFSVISTGSTSLIGDCLFTGANHLTP